MKLSKKLSPCMDDLLIFHPLKLDEIQSLSFGPFKDDHNQILIHVYEIILSFKLWDWTAYVI